MTNPLEGTLIIGLSGRARAGKDTVCAALIDAYKDKYDIRRYALADPLKREVNELNQLQYCLSKGITYDMDPDRSDPLCQTKNFKQSSLLQWYGNFKRSGDPYYWVNKLAACIAEDKPKIAVIPDLRYKNELAFVKAYKGYSIRVNRLGYTDLSRDPRHISEVDLEGTKFDFQIDVADGGSDPVEKAAALAELRADALHVFGLIETALFPVKVEQDNGEELRND